MVSQFPIIYNKLFVNNYLTIRYNSAKTVIFSALSKNTNFFQKKIAKALDKRRQMWYYIKALSVRYAGVVQWQNPSLPSWSCGFDSHHPLLRSLGDFLCTFSSAG